MFIPVSETTPCILNFPLFSVKSYSNVHTLHLYNEPSMNSSMSCQVCKASDLKCFYKDEFNLSTSNSYQSIFLGSSINIDNFQVICASHNIIFTLILHCRWEKTNIYLNKLSSLCIFYMCIIKPDYNKHIQQ